MHEKIYKNSDKEILLDIYTNAIDDFKTRDVPCKGKKQNKLTNCIKALKEGIGLAKKHVERGILLSDKNIVSIKLAYIKYCEFVHCYGQDVVTKTMISEKNRLLDLIIEMDNEEIANYRKNNPGGDYFNFAKAATNKMFRMLIARTSANKSIKKFLEQTDVNQYGDFKNKFFYTKTGSHIHVEGCKCCKGKTIYPVTTAVIEYMDFSYCTCMFEYVSEKASEMKCNNRIFIPKDEVITIFLDESIRDNPFYQKYEGVDNKYSQYSYIACEGGLTSENDITMENMLWSDVGIVKDHNCITVTICAIKEVLLDIKYKHGFDGNVVIYTDNTCAKESAFRLIEESPGGKELLHCLKSVTIVYIPREKNKVADGLGRKVSIIDVPASVMTSVAKDIEDNMKLRRYSEKIKKKNEKLKSKVEELSNQIELLSTSQDCKVLNSLGCENTEKISRIRLGKVDEVNKVIPFSVV